MLAIPSRSTVTARHAGQASLEGSPPKWRPVRHKRARKIKGLAQRPIAPRSGTAVSKYRAIRVAIGVNVKRFGNAEEAMGAIEFAFILPILFTIMLGGTQIVTYINALRKIDLVARSISQMISQTAPLAARPSRRSTRPTCTSATTR